MADSRQVTAAVIATRGRGRLLVVGGIDVRLAYWLPGKPAKGHVPHNPFDKLGGQSLSDLKVRTITV